MVRSLLMKYGIQGGYHDQHFLIDEELLDRIVDSADLCQQDTVLEIGGGIGNLTERIAKHAGSVIVIELDRRLADVLHDRFDNCSNVEIIHADVLDLDLPDFNKVVANLPYSISSPITFKLFKKGFELGILMYQYEFAARMIAPAGSGEYSRLSVNTQYFADVSLLMKIPPSAFSPQPQVWSAVVQVQPRPAPYEVTDEDFFLTFTTAVFNQRRKKLKNAIIQSNHLLKVASIDQVVSHLPADMLSRRAEELQPQELADLANHILALKDRI
ncbi:MAG: 16S rRNA (adenine(1518)-N(6)/adenine(1519)-N(6))-dimethyltransferase RsmA [Methanosarcinaceae archaeon]